MLPLATFIQASGDADQRCKTGHRLPHSHLGKRDDVRSTMELGCTLAAIGFAYLSFRGIDGSCGVKTNPRKMAFSMALWLTWYQCGSLGS